MHEIEKVLQFTVCDTHTVNWNIHQYKYLHHDQAETIKTQVLRVKEDRPLMMSPCPGYNAPYLSVYSENAVDVFDVNTMEWIQTIPLKKVSAVDCSLL